jgi:glycosyltransferase involved in cell wall biosynthesis
MKVRLITVTRVRNEDDIVEAFVRHHAVLVDHMILLDDGSTDRTPDILAALTAEGLPISVYRGQSATFVESAHKHLPAASRRRRRDHLGAVPGLRRVRRQPPAAGLAA